MRGTDTRPARSLTCSDFDVSQHVSEYCMATKTSVATLKHVGKTHAVQTRGVVRLMQPEKALPLSIEFSSGVLPCSAKSPDASLLLKDAVPW